jgi:hypothetical protein
VMRSTTESSSRKKPPPAKPSQHLHQTTSIAGRKRSKMNK